MENHWETSLRIFLESTFEPLKEEKCKWALMGSVASILQGCVLQPNDIDILVDEPEIVYFLSSLLSDYFGENRSPSPFEGKESWFSSEEQPVFEGLGPFSFQWTYSKIRIAQVSIEITHKIPYENHPEMKSNLWESGQNVWPYIKEVPFGSYKLPVIPLEIQLATYLEREFDDRVKQIIQIFRKQGFNEELLFKALDESQRKEIENLFK